MKDLLSLVKGGESPGYITRSEFVLKMLYKLNKISGEDIADISRRFDALDRWHTGRLTPEDIRTHSLWHESQAAAFIVTLRHKSRLHNLTTVVT
eukprot:m.218018 g.218018  ORF g.218018 m.218018 type:complete len:94 (-) comp18676_c0_seq8:131-412(-)